MIHIPYFIFAMYMLAGLIYLAFEVWSMDETIYLLRFSDTPTTGLVFWGLSMVISWPFMLLAFIDGVIRYYLIHRKDQE